MIMRLWRGEITLWKSFWLFGVGGGLIIGLPVFTALMALTDVPEQGTASSFLAALVFFLIYLIWVSVGIWRAAMRYPGEQVWAVLARIAVAFAAGNTLLTIGAVLFGGPR